MKKLGLAVILTVLSPVPATAHTADEGETLFRQRCQMCHSLDPSKPAPLGPVLRGVVGRRAGAGPFAYSRALARSRIIWNRTNLARFLAAPTAMVPGTKMPIAVPDPAQRQAIVAYLAQRRR